MYSINDGKNLLATMLSNNQAKYLHSLRLGKFRDLNRVFLAEGVKLVDELLKSQFTVQDIFATQHWFDSNNGLLDEKDVVFHEVSESELKRVSNLVTPNEVIAVVSYPSIDLPLPDSIGKITLLLDRIQDPGNLGTIIRTADWFGIRHLFCSEDTVDVFNPKVVQSTMGSICRVNLHYGIIEQFVEQYGKTWNIYGTIPGGENIYQSELLFPAAILIGNESRGISEEYFSLLTHRIGIPALSDGAESLNASVAAAIVISEFCRRMF
jgi:TrmH family RNA methyltransferase